MRVLVACEFSGRVMAAFRRRGHDAWSCDLLPSEVTQTHHIKGDVRYVLTDGWDLMVAHPPCTYICNSGVRHLVSNLDRWDDMVAAVEFFQTLLAAPIPHIAIENPIPHGVASSQIGRYTQKIQPWQFGHGETKATCLWLKNLPTLVPSAIVDGRAPKTHHEPPGPNRWKNRSRTYHGIADAMAEQWGEL